MAASLAADSLAFDATYFAFDHHLAGEQMSGGFDCDLFSPLDALARPIAFGTTAANVRLMHAPSRHRVADTVRALAEEYGVGMIAPYNGMVSFCGMVATSRIPDLVLALRDAVDQVALFTDFSVVAECGDWTEAISTADALSLSGFAIPSSDHGL